MSDLEVGKISFGNTRIGHALSIIQDEHLDGQMWKYECFKLQNERDKLVDEIADLKKKLEKYGRKIKK